jgi:hypothetical protein
MRTSLYRYGWLPEWQRQIITRYPLIYIEPSPERARYYAGYPEKCPEDYTNLRCGFECSGGWAKLIEQLSTTATDLVKALRAFGYQDDAAISACICKEKFGVLRWQGDHNLLPPFAGLWCGYFRDIEHRSSCTCEECGKSGVLRDVGPGWVKTLCDADYQKALGSANPR